MKKAMYLKVNRTEDFVYRNISIWIAVGLLINADTYILCDKEELNKNIKKYIDIGNAIFLSSYKSEEMREIVDVIAEDSWKNASYAHMTTFVHAAENGYDYFWNIDADDTFVCLSTDRTAQMLMCAEEYAQKNDINIFSLDMWRSFSVGTHWSFGITYTDAGINWLKIMKDNYESYKKYLNNLKSKIENCNIDWYFTYLSKEINNQTFYFENLKFVHYSDELYNNPINSILYHWKDNILLLPVVYDYFNIPEYGKYKIAEDIVKLDIDISDEETVSAWASYVNLKVYYYRLIKMIKKEIAKNMNFAVWGAGYAFEQIQYQLKNMCKIQCIVDNDPEKWGKEFYGIKCISPSELKSMKNTAVIIASVTPGYIESIHNQLTEMGIEKIIHLMDINFLR